MSNRFVPINPNSDTSQQMALINKNFAELDNEGVTKIYSDNTGTPNIAIGVQQDGTSRIRIAKAGIDVTKATDDQLSFNSAQNTFKIVLTGTASITAATGQSRSVVITHNLGYLPIGVVSLTDSGLNFGNTLPYFSGFSIGASLEIGQAAYFDLTTTTLRIYLATSTSVIPDGTPSNFRYYLLQETSN